jgi:transporter family-2 protein
VSKELAVLLTVAAGGLVAAQAPANNVISGQVGDFGAGLVSFLVGTALILVLTFTVAGGIQGDEGAQAAPWYYWIIGGVSGAAIVVITLITVRELGAGGATAAVIAGQLALSVVLDRAGVLGLDERAITWEKLLGIALLVAGTVLIVRE